MIQALLVTGLALLLAVPWVLPALVPALLLLSYAVVPHEDRYLECRFGDEYREYRRRVRRWL